MVGYSSELEQADNNSSTSSAAAPTTDTVLEHDDVLIRSFIECLRHFTDGGFLFVIGYGLITNPANFTIAVPRVSRQ